MRAMFEQMDAPQASVGPFWRVYEMRLTPVAHVDKDSDVRHLDGEKALEHYRALIRETDARDPWTRGSVVINVNRCNSMTDRGSIVYSCNMDRKAYRGRILAHDARLFLPSVKPLGHLIGKTWPDWPSWVTGVRRLVMEGGGSVDRAHLVHLVAIGSIPADILELHDERNTA